MYRPPGPAQKRFQRAACQLPRPTFRFESDRKIDGDLPDWANLEIAISKSDVAAGRHPSLRDQVMTTPAVRVSSTRCRAGLREGSRQVIHSNPARVRRYDRPLLIGKEQLHFPSMSLACPIHIWYRRRSSISTCAHRIVHRPGSALVNSSVVGAARLLEMVTDTTEDDVGIVAIARDHPIPGHARGPVACDAIRTRHRHERRQNAVALCVAIFNRLAMMDRGICSSTNAKRKALVKKRSREPELRGYTVPARGIAFLQISERGVEVICQAAPVFDRPGG